MRGIDAVDNNTVWVTGSYWTLDTLMSDQSPRYSKAAVLRTTDGGNTWSLWTFEDGKYARKICALDEYTAWVVLDGCKIVTTNDGGASWKYHDEFKIPDGDSLTICTVDADIVWVAVDNDYIYLSEDGGKSWSCKKSRWFCIF